MTIEMNDSLCCYCHKQGAEFTRRTCSDGRLMCVCGVGKT
jgi:hypothetical protein